MQLEHLQRYKAWHAISLKSTKTDWSQDWTLKQFIASGSTGTGRYQQWSKM